MTPSWAGSDLRPMFGPVRDQGQRPTCLSFAASAVHEHARGLLAPLSTEALHQASKARDGLPSDAATTVGAMLASLQTEGQCDESEWPYGTGQPTAIAGAFLMAESGLRTRSLLGEMVASSIAGGSSVLIVLQLTTGWFAVGADGRVPGPSPVDAFAGYHAVVAVGSDAPAELVLFRNSWGDLWGDRGYGQVSHDYLATYGVEALTLEPL